MRRREILVALASVGVFGSPASAQQSQKPKRIGVLTGLAENNPGARSIEELRRALDARGWHEGENLRVSEHFAAGDPERLQRFVAELVGLKPDVIVAHTAQVVAAALHEATRTLPIVFVSIPDPVADGFVASLARPGGNMTGFTNYEFAIGGKWVEVLKEMAPDTRRVTVLLNPDAKSSYSSYAGYWQSVEAAARAISIKARLAPGHNRDEIEAALAALAAEPGGGLIVPPSAPVVVYLGDIVEMAARYRVPAIYPFAIYARQGGLVAYGTSLGDLFRRAADYVDRILNGASPADLPVQGPTKLELAINLKTAKALGLTVSESLVARADEVIE